ncbi:MAG: Gfo/Idh/MocA family protein [Armatimonadota bacterium]
MADRVRLALIGCGGISRAHLNGIAELSDLVELVATCDADRARAEQAAQRGGAEVVCEDYHEVLGRDDVDAVDILLPHDLHCEATVAAAEAGKHVLCEKPIAPTAEEAEEMIAASEAVGVKLMIAYCERYSAEHAAARRLLDEGAIGRPYLMRIDHNQWVWAPEGHWLNDPEKLGGGTVAGSGTHRLDLLRWLNGEVKRVAAFFHTTGLTNIVAEDTATVILEHENGALGEMLCCWSARQGPWYESFWIYGDRGTMHNVGGLKLARTSPDEAPTGFEKVKLPHDDTGGFREEIRHFAECVLHDREPLTNGVEALKTLQLVQAVYQAAQERRVVDL